MKKLIAVCLAAIIILCFSSCSESQNKTVEELCDEGKAILEYVFSEYGHTGINGVKTDVPSAFENRNFSSMKVTYDNILEDYFNKLNGVDDRIYYENTKLYFSFEGPNVLFLKGKGDYYIAPIGYYDVDPDKNYKIYVYMPYGSKELSNIEGNRIVLEEKLEYEVKYSLTIKNHRVDSLELSLTEVGESGLDGEEIQRQAKNMFESALRESIEMADEWIYEGSGYHWF